MIGILFILGIFALIILVILTLINIHNLCSETKVLPRLTDGSIIILGSVFSIVLYYFWNPYDYQSALRTPRMDALAFHAPIGSWHMLTILVLIGMGLIGYGILRIYQRKLPPLIIVGCISLMFISAITGIIWVLQLIPHAIEAGVFFPFESLFFMLFPINYILCYYALIKKLVCEYNLTEREVKYQNAFLNHCNSLLIHSKNWPLLALIAMIPLLAITILILTIFGQQPNSAIRAFTETSDWLLSQQISPPPIEVDAHYLCTVSLRGHCGFVKPLRYGLRRGHRIIVNRQLCIANAFEELLQERVPRLHFLIRRGYDLYGYPLSRHINTQLSADITYAVMKPLEWVFVLLLYLLDQKPEDRIARQYLPEIDS